MGYNPNIPHLYVGWNPFANHLLTSWDIQVHPGPGQKWTCKSPICFFTCCLGTFGGWSFYSLKLTTSFATENRPFQRPKRKRSSYSSNHPFSGRVVPQISCLKSHRNLHPLLRNKGFIAGLFKGKQWFPLSPDHKAGYFWGGCRLTSHSSRSWKSPSAMQCLVQGLQQRFAQ